MIAGEDGPVRVLSRDAGAGTHTLAPEKGFDLPRSVIRNRNHVSFVSEATGVVANNRVDFTNVPAGVYNLQVVVNGKIATKDQPIHDGDKVLFMSPISGG